MAQTWTDWTVSFLVFLRWPLNSIGVGKPRPLHTWEGGAWGGDEAEGLCPVPTQGQEVEQETKGV